MFGNFGMIRINGMFFFGMVEEEGRIRDELYFNFFRVCFIYIVFLEDLILFLLLLLKRKCVII